MAENFYLETHMGWARSIHLSLLTYIIRKDFFYKTKSLLINLNFVPSTIPILRQVKNNINGVQILHVLI